MGIFQNIPNLKILILRIILRKLQISMKNSKNKTILRIRMLVNTGPVGPTISEKSASWSYRVGESFLRVGLQFSI